MSIKKIDWENCMLQSRTRMWTIIKVAICLMQDSLGSCLRNPLGSPLTLARALLQEDSYVVIFTIVIDWQRWSCMSGVSNRAMDGKRSDRIHGIHGQNKWTDIQEQGQNPGAELQVPHRKCRMTRLENGQEICQGLDQDQSQ